MTSQPPGRAPSRALIVKFGAIGDCVMALPGARALHAAGYTVEWVCGRAVAPVLALFPWIELHVVDDAALLRGSAATRVRGVADLWRRVAGRRYDLCATLYYDARYKLLTLPVRARRKVMLSHADRALTLLPGRHHTDEYARILTGAADNVKPAQLPPLRATGLPPNPHPRRAGQQRVVIVAAGARNLMRDDALRRWPVASYAAVAQTLLERGYEVVLAGGPEDTWASAAFTAVAGHAAFADLTGRLSLVEMLALLDSADLTLTHDTGPLHLAGMTASAVLAIFGPTDPRGRLPQRADCTALWGGEGFACRPCYDGRAYAPCERNLCVEQITPGTVVAEAETMLGARRAGQHHPPRVRTPRHTPVAAFLPAGEWPR